MGRKNVRQPLVNFIGILSVGLYFVQGCGRVGEKSASMAVIYAIAALLSVFLLLLYCMMIQKKEVWFLVLFGSVIIVNVGYLTLAISKTLGEALLANRIAYLGSVFLPLSMFMIIMKVCRLKYKKWVPTVLIIVSVLVFLVAASPGYSDIYYKEVTLGSVNGVTVLNKTYGAWHDLYLIYLLGYFVAMIAMIIYAKVRKKADSDLYATILGGAVFVNIGLWLLEQLIRMDFELLSISYVITEFFLLSLCMMMQEKVSAVHKQEAGQMTREPEPQSEQREENEEVSEEWKAKCKFFKEHISLLTKTEKRIYDFYLEGKTTKEIMKDMDITENTLKYHNKNIYSKLGVSSRKQLQEIARQI